MPLGCDKGVLGHEKSGIRKNRIIMDAVRYILHLKQLPKSFWVKEISCTIYLLNRCSTKCFYGNNPQKAQSHRKHNIGHLRMFGCITYAHLFDTLQKKT